MDPEIDSRSAESSFKAKLPVVLGYAALVAGVFALQSVRFVPRQIADRLMVGSGNFVMDFAAASLGGMVLAGAVTRFEDRTRDETREMVAAVAHADGAGPLVVLVHDSRAISEVQKLFEQALFDAGELSDLTAATPAPLD